MMQRLITTRSPAARAFSAAASSASPSCSQITFARRAIASSTMAAMKSRRRNVDRNARGPGTHGAAALLALANASLAAAPARAEGPLPPRYELLFSPTLDAESGTRLVSSAVTGTGAGEERLFRPLGPGAGGAVARGARTLV